ncbi:MAG: hypothetical protein ABEJ61_10550 [Haloferacaceae archaeon]
MRRPVRAAAAVALAAAALPAPALAHVGGLSGSTADGSVPTWLTVVTGGVVVGASFVFTSLLTDHDAIRAVNEARVRVAVPWALRRVATWGLRAASAGVLALVVLGGLVGPTTPRRNVAILVVWVGWWAGYTMTVYAVGNTWPAVNPWRALAELLPRARRREYPASAGAWPAVVGLLALVWLEVVSPVADDPRLLVGVVAAYSAATLAGATVYGPDRWFDAVDPVARVFRCYGRTAPVQRTERGLAVGLPATALVDTSAREEPGHVAFVVALLWATTYDGLVATPAWAAAVRPVVALGVPALLVYLVAILVGFGAFYGVYRLAARRARLTADTHVTAAYLRRYLVPSLVPIAAGYHVAHFLAYLLALAPTLGAVALAPLAPPPGAPVLVVPDWVDVLQLGFVLLGHLLAVWVAHARSFDLFPGVLTPIRSQYPVIVAMVFYTMTSMWVVVQPFGDPPFV